jgi:hypothetical protein
MPVFPLDLQTLARGQMHLHRLRIIRHPRRRINHSHAPSIARYKAQSGAPRFATFETSAGWPRGFAAATGVPQTTRLSSAELAPAHGISLGDKATIRRQDGSFRKSNSHRMPFAVPAESRVAAKEFSHGLSRGTSLHMIWGNEARVPAYPRLFLRRSSNNSVPVSKSRGPIFGRYFLGWPRACPRAKRVDEAERFAHVFCALTWE